MSLIRFIFTTYDRDHYHLRDIRWPEPSYADDGQASDEAAEDADLDQEEPSCAASEGPDDAVPTPNRVDVADELQYDPHGFQEDEQQDLVQKLGQAGPHPAADAEQCPDPAAQDSPNQSSFIPADQLPTELQQQPSSGSPAVGAQSDTGARIPADHEGHAAAAEHGAVANNSGVAHHAHSNQHDHHQQQDAGMQHECALEQQQVLRPQRQEPAEDHKEQQLLNETQEPQEPEEQHEPLVQQASIALQDYPAPPAQGEVSTQDGITPAQQQAAHDNESRQQDQQPDGSSMQDPQAALEQQQQQEILQEPAMAADQSAPEASTAAAAAAAPLQDKQLQDTKKRKREEDRPAEQQQQPQDKQQDRQQDKQQVRQQQQDKQQDKQQVSSSSAGGGRAERDKINADRKRDRDGRSSGHGSERDKRDRQQEHEQHLKKRKAQDKEDSGAAADSDRSHNKLKRGHQESRSNRGGKSRRDSRQDRDRGERRHEHREQHRDSGSGGASRKESSSRRDKDKDRHGKDRPTRGSGASKEPATAATAAAPSAKAAAVREAAVNAGSGAAASTPAPAAPDPFALMGKFLSKQKHAQDVLLPCPSNVDMLSITADQALSVIQVQQWAQQQLRLSLPLLNGCFVLVPASNLPAEQLLLPPDVSKAAIPWQQRAIPGLSGDNGSSAADSGSGSDTSIPWRLRQVEAVELPAAAGGGGADAADAEMLLCGGGRVKARDINSSALAAVPDHQFLCCELSALQQQGKLQPLKLYDIAAASWRLRVVAELQGRITEHEQNQAQLLAAGYGADMLKSDTQATHQAARSIIRKLPAVNWLAQEILPYLELPQPASTAAPAATTTSTTTADADAACAGADQPPDQPPLSDPIAAATSSAAAAWDSYVRHKHLQQQQQLGEGSVALAAPFKPLLLDGPGEAAPRGDGLADGTAATTVAAGGDVAMAGLPTGAAGPTVAAATDAATPPVVGQPQQQEQRQEQQQQDQDQVLQQQQLHDSYADFMLEQQQLLGENVSPLKEKDAASAAPAPAAAVAAAPGLLDPLTGPPPVPPQQQQQDDLDPMEQQLPQSSPQPLQQALFRFSGDGFDDLDFLPDDDLVNMDLQPLPPVDAAAAAAVGGPDGVGTLSLLDDGDDFAFFPTSAPKPSAAAPLNPGDPYQDALNPADGGAAPSQPEGLAKAGSQAGLKAGGSGLGGSGQAGKGSGFHGPPLPATGRVSSRYGAMFGGAGSGSGQLQSHNSSSAKDILTATAAAAAGAGAKAGGAAAAARATGAAGLDDIYKQFGLDSSTPEGAAAATGGTGAAAGAARVRKDGSEDVAAWLDRTAAAAATTARHVGLQQRRRLAPTAAAAAAAPPPPPPAQHTAAGTGSVQANGRSATSGSVGAAAAAGVSGRGSHRSGSRSRSPFSRRAAAGAAAADRLHRSRSRSRSNSPAHSNGQRGKATSRTRPGSRSRSRSRSNEPLRPGDRSRHQGVPLRRGSSTGDRRRSRSRSADGRAPHNTRDRSRDGRDGSRVPLRRGGMAGDERPQRRRSPSRDGGVLCRRVSSPGGSRSPPRRQRSPSADRQGGVRRGGTSSKAAAAAGDGGGGGGSGGRESDPVVAKALSGLSKKLCKALDAKSSGQVSLSNLRKKLEPPLSKLLDDCPHLTLAKVIADHLPKFTLSQDGHKVLYARPGAAARTRPVCRLWRPVACKGCKEGATCPDRHDLPPKCRLG